MDYIYLLTIVDKNPNEYTNDRQFMSAYADDGLARYYLIEDVKEQMLKGRIKNMDGLTDDITHYSNNGIVWDIQKIHYVKGLK